MKGRKNSFFFYDFFLPSFATFSSFRTSAHAMEGSVDTLLQLEHPLLKVPCELLNKVSFREISFSFFFFLISFDSLSWMKIRHLQSDKFLSFFFLFLLKMSWQTFRQSQKLIEKETQSLSGTIAELLEKVEAGTLDPADAIRLIETHTTRLQTLKKKVLILVLLHSSEKN